MNEFKVPANVRAVQAQLAQIAYIHTLSSDSLAASRHTPRIECPLQLHLQLRVSQNRMHSAMWQSALSLAGFKADQDSLFNKVSLFFGQRAIRRVLLRRLVHPVVFISGFHHRSCLMQACAQMRNRVHAITGHPAHTVQASVLTVLVFVVPQMATPSVQLLVSGSSKGCLICHQCT